MTLRLKLTGLVAGLVLPAILAVDANADHRRHWFFDSYGRYEAEANTYYTPRRWKRRRPVVVYEEPLYSGNEEFLEDEYVEPRKAKRWWRWRAERRKDRRAKSQNRWREKRLRYDLAPNGRQLLGQPAEPRTKRLTVVPIPREKPYVDHSVTTASIDDAIGLNESQPLDAIERPAISATQPKVATRAAIAPTREKTSTGQVSCSKAQDIVSGFGFTDIQAKSCAGASYDFAAKRDGKPFSITLSATSGELTDVKRN